MESLKTKIKEFLKIEYDFGCGFGDDGSGDSSVYGSGYGYGSGSGSGDGFGYGYGPGSSDGFGYGDGTGYGFGLNYSNKLGIKFFNKQEVYMVDEVPTIITNIKNNFAKGAILNSDLTLTPCFIVKANNLFAHGKTLREAIINLQSKMFSKLNIDERIKEFNKIFKPNQKYKGHEFYKWHNLLTGSCELGRNTFIKNHNINLDDEFTIEEFVNICKDSYGGEIISRLIKEEKE